MSWLTGSQLERYIKKYGDEKTKYAFLGIFAIDHLPQSIPHLPLLLIVNTHAVNLPGEHWKAIYISHERKGEVFDSLATVISIPLLQWLNTFTNKWTHSRLTIQHPASPSCGAFVLYFILNRLNVKNMKDIVDCFSNNLADNDIMMRAYVKSLK